MRSLIRPIAAAALSAAWLLSVPAANAQAQAPNGAQVQQPSANISDQKLNATAAAMKRVLDIQQNYQQQIAAAPPAEKQRIGKETSDAIEKAVTDQGLSVQEYSSILEVAQNDPTVRQKLMLRLRPAPAGQ